MYRKADIQAAMERAWRLSTGGPVVPLNWVEGEKRHRQSLGAVTASEAEVSFLKVPGDTWKVQIIEEDFHRPVSAVEGA